MKRPGGLDRRKFLACMSQTAGAVVALGARRAFADGDPIVHQRRGSAAASESADKDTTKETGNVMEHMDTTGVSR